jgi:GT2 family glycosyltransferase
MSASISPLVSVIVVNWNGKAVIEDCLLSLTQQTYSPLEIIVVDNGSKDSSVTLIQEKFGAVIHLVQNSINLGFAGGNNVGIRVSRGKYILLLNNDATADPRWVEELVKVAESDPGIGMCASKIYSFDEPGILDSAGGLLIYRDGLSRGRGRLERDQGQYDCVEEVLLPSGCACLYRRKMLDQIGLFDEDFFAYSDDTDLGLRGRIAGWRCVYVPTAIAFHRYSASAGRYSPLKAFLAERNRVWVAIKNFPLPALILSPLFTLWRLFLHVYALLRKRGVTGRFTERYTTRSLFLTILKAYGSAIVHLPKMWTKRKLILRTRKVSGSVIYSWLRIYKITAWELAFKE